MFSLTLFLSHTRMEYSLSLSLSVVFALFHRADSTWCYTPCLRCRDSLQWRSEGEGERGCCRQVAFLHPHLLIVSLNLHLSMWSCLLLSLQSSQWYTSLPRSLLLLNFFYSARNLQWAQQWWNQWWIWSPPSLPFHITLQVSKSHLPLLLFVTSQCGVHWKRSTVQLTCVCMHEIVSVYPPPIYSTTNCRCVSRDGVIG